MEDDDGLTMDATRDLRKLLPVLRAIDAILAQVVAYAVDRRNQKEKVPLMFLPFGDVPTQASSSVDRWSSSRSSAGYSMPMADYKQAKEAFVSGSTGGTIARINSVCLTALVRPFHLLPCRLDQSAAYSTS